MLRSVTDETTPTPVQLGEKAAEHPLLMDEGRLPYWLNFGGPIIFDKWDRRVLKVPEGRYNPVPHADFINVLAWTAMNLGSDITDVIEKGEGITEEQLQRIQEIIYGIGFAMGDGCSFNYPYGRERWIGAQLKALRAARWLRRFPRRLYNRVNPYYKPPTYAGEVFTSEEFLAMLTEKGEATITGEEKAEERRLAAEDSHEDGA